MATVQGKRPIVMARRTVAPEPEWDEKGLHRPSALVPPRESGPGGTVRAPILVRFSKPHRVASSSSVASGKHGTWLYHRGEHVFVPGTLEQHPALKRPPVSIDRHSEDRLHLSMDNHSENLAHVRALPGVEHHGGREWSVPLSSAESLLHRFPVSAVTPQAHAMIQAHAPTLKAIHKQSAHLITPMRFEEPAQAAHLKLPHEMTRAEFFQHKLDTSVPYQNTHEPQNRQVAFEHIKKNAFNEHHTALLHALMDGHTMAPHVLADYPDIAEAHARMHPASAPHAPSPPAAVKDVTGEKRQRVGVRIKRRESSGTGSLFDEEAHPRAQQGGVNPTSGKTSKPGQFTEKPKGAARDDSHGPTQASTQESSDTAAAEGATGAVGGDRNVRPDVSGESAGESAEDVRRTRARRATRKRRRPGAGTGEGLHLLFDFGEGHGPERGEESGAADVHPAAGREDSAGSEPESVLDVVDAIESALDGDDDEFQSGHQFSAPLKVGNDYRITPEDKLGQGTERVRYENNLAAIRTLRAIEAEGRLATPEEQAVLAKYTGWGWAGSYFDRRNEWTGHTYFKPPHPKEYKELRELLTPKEFEAASASTTNAHYTSERVVTALWEAARHLGFTGGRVLEPAMGSGNFFGLCPSDFWARSQFTGVELDDLTARMAKQLYQSADVRHAGFEATNLPDNYFDLAIGNVPFGKYGVFDEKWDNPRQRFLTRSIHNYFFARALEKVRPGGIVAFITSHHTMDAPSGDNIRAYLASKADLLGAIRLPNDAFKENAGTEVTTDVIFLKKRAEGQEKQGEDWTGLGGVDDIEGNPTNVNAYFARHPEMMLGTMHPNAAAGAYQGYGLVSNGKDLDMGLDEAIHALPADALQPLANPATAPRDMSSALLADTSTHNGSYEIANGRLYVNHKGELEPVTDKSEKVMKRIVGMAGLRVQTQRLLAIMADAATSDVDIADAQRNLHTAYDSFVKQFGFVNSRDNTRAFSDDPDMAVVLALEKWDDESQTGTKADLFSKRINAPAATVTAAGSPLEAMLHALNEKNCLDWQRMSELTGQKPQQLQRRLQEQGHIFLNPEGDWETRDSYLSGNIREKLAAAEGAALNDSRFAPNVEALRAVMPRDLEPTEIVAKLGASWIHPDIVSGFVQHLIGYDRKLKVTYVPNEAAWVFTPPSESGRYGTRNTVQWGTDDWEAWELVRAACNQQLPVVWRREKGDGVERKYIDREATAAAREKLDAIKEEFKNWIWSDPKRAEVLARKYNVLFNSCRERDYNGQHLSLPGLSTLWRTPGKMKPHVKDAVWRMLQSPTTLLDHTVGAGKTAECVCAAMEMKRLGQCKKPMFVVPKHLVAQWARDIHEIYPAARVLMTSSDDFTKANRKKLMAKIATNEWDAVLVAHTHFGKLATTPETDQAYFGEQIDQLRDILQEVGANGGDKRTQKQIEAAIKRLQVKLQRRLAHKGQDDTIPFEHMGVDQLFVDEAHLYKNLFFPTKMTRVAGLPNAESDRAFDMFMKCQYLQKTHGGRGVVFATGTPVSNTVAEMYTMQRYLQLPTLEKMGLQHFDAWAANFGDTVVSVELSPDGRGYRPRTRFARFTNVPELSQMVSQFCDVKTRDDLKDYLALPDVERHMVTCKPSPEQTAYVRRLGARASAILGENGQKPPDPREDNMLKLMSDGRKAALDIRLVDPTAPEAPDSKVSRCADNVVQVWRDSESTRGTQVVFLDLSTPKGQRDTTESDTANDEAIAPETEASTEDEQRLTDSVYQDLRRKLLARGIPAKEIAFIHDAKTDGDKLTLFKKVQDGQVRVLIGSTEKMGTGMNVQNRLLALHHIDCPWRPADLEQREGRIIRQGNTNPKVHIYSYATEGENGAISMDTIMYQTVEQKARAINQILQGKTGARTVDDADMVMTASEMKALCSGDPLVKEKVDLDHEIANLEVSFRAHQQQQFRSRKRLEQLPGEIEGYRKNLDRLKKLIAYREENKPEKFAITVKGRFYDEQDAGGKALSDYAKAQSQPEPKEIGEYAGWRLGVSADALGGGGIVYVGMPGEAQWAGSFSIGDTPGGTIQRLRNLLRAFDKDQEKVDRDLTSASLDMATLPDQLQPWPKAERLRQLKARRDEVNQALGIGKESDVIASDEEEGSVSNEEPTVKSIQIVVHLCKAIYKPAARYIAPMEFDRTGKSRIAPGGARPVVFHKLTRAQFARAFPYVSPDYHAKLVRAALEQGKVVPKRVRQDYPHLFGEGKSSSVRQAAVHLRSSSESDASSGTTGPTGQSRRARRSDRPQSGVMEEIAGPHSKGLSRLPCEPALLDERLEKAMVRHEGIWSGESTDMRERGPSRGQRMRAGIGAGMRGALAGASRIAVKLTQSSARQSQPDTQDQAHIAPLHAMARAQRLRHVTTQVRQRKSLLGGKGERSYHHWYNHRTPLVKAKQLSYSLAAQGHGVSRIAQTRVYVNGGIRHQYSFNVQASDTGARHTVSVFRP